MEQKAEKQLHNREFLWFLLAFILAASLRFIQLGSLPLGTNEANLAFQAFGLAKGTTPVIGGQPGYVALTSILFSIFQPSNFWALFWPALFGSAIVFVPMLFKGQLSSRCALLLAFILALDPSLVAVSRSASGSMITLVSFVAALGFLVRKRSIWAGLFAGMVILGGIISWPVLVVTAVTGMVFLFSIPLKDKEKNPFYGVNWKKFIAASVATVLLVGTDFLIHPTVINGLGAGITQFFTDFVSGGGASFKAMLLSLPLSELLLLVLGIWGVIAGLIKNDNLTKLLGYSAVLFTLVILFDQSRHVSNWVWMILPLSVLAALGLDDLIGMFIPLEKGVTAAQAVLTIVLIVFSFLNLSHMVINPPADAAATRDYMLQIFLPLAFLLVVTLLLAFGWSVIAARQGLLIGIGVLLLCVTIGSSWKAAGLGPRPEAELWRDDPLPTGCELVRESTSTLSIMDTGIENRIDVTLFYNDAPSLQWCLRDYDKLKVAGFLTDAGTSSIIITSADSSTAPAANYRGETIPWTNRVDYDNMSASNWLIWFITRRAPMVQTNLVLWARDDLFLGK